MPEINVEFGCAEHLREGYFRRGVLDQPLVLICDRCEQPAVEFRYYMKDEDAA